MKIEKLRSKLKKVFNRVMGVLLPVATLFVSCGTNALIVRANEESEKVYTLTCSNDYIHKVGNTETRYVKNYTLSIKGKEIVGILGRHETFDTREKLADTIHFKSYDEKNRALYDFSFSGWNSIVSFSGNFQRYNNGSLSVEGTLQKSETSLYIKGYKEYTVNSYSIKGDIKYFDSEESAKKYFESGDTSGMIEVKDPENEKNWYLKNVSYKVTADDSPSSEAGADATYIHFSWDTDNLQDGDLLEIKTYNYYKKILGEKLSGFHDFITYSDGVAASSGKYSFSQYVATKAWFNSLENKPLAFKEYDTTDYYLRPVRMGALGVEKYGGWVHIKMGRSTPTSSPYIEDVEYGDFDDDNNWTVDEDLTDKNGGHHGIDQGGDYIPPDQSENPFTGTNLAGMFSYFFDFMKNIPSMLADLPALVSSVIGFLPPVIIGFIGIGVVIAIILRVVGR